MKWGDFPVNRAYLYRFESNGKHKLNRFPDLNEERIAPELSRWCEGAELDALHTVVLRIKRSTPLDAFVRKMTDAGIAVESSGRGSTTAVVTCEQLARLSNSEEIVSITEPREMYMKFAATRR